MKLLLSIALVLAQQPAKNCVPCKDAGRIACSKHPAAECALEDEVGYCSELAGCAVCGGAGFVLCERCKPAAMREKLEKRRKWIQGRAPALKPIDDKMGRPLRKVETDHFVFVWEMDKYKIGKELVSPHEGMHVYAARLEALFADYCKTLAIEASALEEKCWVFVWYLPEDQAEAGTKFCDGQSERGVTYLGMHPRYSVCGNKKFYAGDVELHRNVVHQVTHVLLSHQQPQAWLGERKSGWADEGLAYLFEEKVNGIIHTYCQQEMDNRRGFENGKFRVGVRKLVAAETAPPMAEVTQLDRDGLTPEMNAVSFSYVDYLSTLGGEKLDALMKKLKSRVPVRDVVQEVYGMGLLELEAKWKAWVLETYPAK